MTTEERIDMIEEKIQQIDNRLTQMENLLKKIFTLSKGILIGIVIAGLLFGFFSLKELIEIVK